VTDKVVYCCWVSIYALINDVILFIYFLFLHLAVPLGSVRGNPGYSGTPVGNHWPRQYVVCYYRRNDLWTVRVVSTSWWLDRAVWCTENQQMHQNDHFIVMSSETLLHVSAYQRHHQRSHMILTSYVCVGVHYRNIKWNSSSQQWTVVEHGLGRVPQQSMTRRFSCLLLTSGLQTPNQELYMLPHLPTFYHNDTQLQATLVIRDLTLRVFAITRFRKKKKPWENCIVILESPCTVVAWLWRARTSWSHLTSISVRGSVELLM
jgi:hypothetical protein